MLIDVPPNSTGLRQIFDRSSTGIYLLGCHMVSRCARSGAWCTDMVLPDMTRAYICSAGGIPSPWHLEERGDFRVDPFLSSFIWEKRKPFPKETLSGWWFGTFFIFHNIWDNPSHWLIFFRGAETTNQLLKSINKDFPWLYDGYMSFVEHGVFPSNLPLPCQVRRKVWSVSPAPWDSCCRTAKASRASRCAPWWSVGCWWLVWRAYCIGDGWKRSDERQAGRKASRQAGR